MADESMTTSAPGSISWTPNQFPSASLSASAAEARCAPRAVPHSSAPPTSIGTTGHSVQATFICGKPLLLVDTDKNYGPGDFDDARFTVRWVYNGDNHVAIAQHKTWGWGSSAPAPVL